MNKRQVHRGVAWELARIGWRPVRRGTQATAIYHVTAHATRAKAIGQATGERVALVMVEIDVVIGDVRQLVGGK